MLVASTSVNTLIRFQNDRMLRAENGGNGGSANKTGKSGRDLRVDVPVGTEVRDISRRGKAGLIGDLIAPGDELVVARGGAGGSGNTRFVSATNQQPLLAESGEPGEQKQLRLDLKLLADIGLIGMPNAGKSSILAAISAAKPKIASYPFTTLEPVLGVVYHQLDAFVVVDIPGLIEGAHSGTGLGDEFLKHVERTRVLAHVVDGSEPDVAARVRVIEKELQQFNPELAGRPRLFVVNKLDLEGVRSRTAELKRELAAATGEDGGVLFVSAATHEGVQDLVAMMWQALQDAPRPYVEGDSVSGQPTVLRPKPVDRPPTVEQVDDSVFRIVHPRAVRLARGSNLGDWATLVQFQKKLGDFGVTRDLEVAGVKAGDTVLVDDLELEWD